MDLIFGSGKRKKSKKYGKFKIKKIKKSKKNVIQINSINSVTTKKYLEKSYIINLLSRLENTLNKSDYAKLKKKINSVFKKKTKKKSKKILKLISTIKKFNNGKLIPENINLNTVIVTRQDSPITVLSKFINFVGIIGLLLGQQYIANNAYTAFENFNKLDLSKQQLSLPKPQLYQLIAATKLKPNEDKSRALVPVKTKKKIGFSWAMSFPKDKPSDDNKINIIVDNINNTKKSNISFAKPSLLPKINKYNMGLLLFITLLYISYGNKAKKYYNRLLKNMSNKKKRKLARNYIRSITRQGVKNEKKTQIQLKNEFEMYKKNMKLVVNNKKFDNLATKILDKSIDSVKSDLLLDSFFDSVSDCFMSDRLD